MAPAALLSALTSVFGVVLKGSYVELVDGRESASSEGRVGMMIGGGVRSFFAILGGVGETFGESQEERAAELAPQKAQSGHPRNQSGRWRANRAPPYIRRSARENFP